MPWVGMGERRRFSNWLPSRRWSGPLCPRRGRDRKRIGGGVGGWRQKGWANRPRGRWCGWWHEREKPGRGRFAARCAGAGIRRCGRSGEGPEALGRKGNRIGRLGKGANGRETKESRSPRDARTRRRIIWRRTGQRSKRI